jgi:hypothetical protein
MISKYLKDNALEDMKVELSKMKSECKIIHDKYYDDKVKSASFHDPKVMKHYHNLNFDIHFFETTIKRVESESA